MATTRVQERVRLYMYADGYNYRIDRPVLIQYDPLPEGGVFHTVEDDFGRIHHVMPGWRVVQISKLNPTEVGDKK